MDEPTGDRSQTPAEPDSPAPGPVVPAGAPIDIEPSPAPAEPVPTSGWTEPPETRAEPAGPTDGWIQSAATPSDPDTTSGWIQPSPNKPRSRGKTAAILAGIAVLLAIPGVKLVSTILAASVAATALTSAFGGPYDQLPADFRSGIESRFKAIAPQDFGQLSDAEQTAWLQAQVRGGLVRLDDATLTRRFRSLTHAFGQVPVATCAAVARETSSGGTTSPETGRALLTAMTVDERKDWFEISIAAAEAQAHGTPVPRTVTEDEFDKAFDALRSEATPDELSAMAALGGGATQDDATVCSGYRAIYSIALRLSAADLATAARYDVQ